MEQVHKKYVLIAGQEAKGNECISRVFAVGPFIKKYYYISILYPIKEEKKQF